MTEVRTDIFHLNDPLEQITLKEATLALMEVITYLRSNPPSYATLTPPQETGESWLLSIVMIYGFALPKRFIIRADGDLGQAEAYKVLVKEAMSKVRQVP